MLHEVAFYRFVDQSRTAAIRPPGGGSSSLFRAEVATNAAADIEQFADDAQRRALQHPSNYGASQCFGTDARAAGIEVIRYPSVRDPDAGACVAVLTPAAFASPRPLSRPQRWNHQWDGDRLIFQHADELLLIARDTFLINGELPMPAG